MSVSRIKYLAINGHGRNKVMKDYYENGGKYNMGWIEAGNPMFLEANVCLLHSEVTYDDRLMIVFMKFEQEAEGQKHACCWDFLKLFGDELKHMNYAQIEAKYKHVKPARYQKTRITEYRGAYSAWSSIPGGLEALKHYTDFVETDRGLKGIMGVAALYNNKELELCTPEVKQEVLQCIRETCDESNFFEVVNEQRFRWTSQAMANWRCVDNGPAC
jgi:hypothetical protein